METLYTFITKFLSDIPTYLNAALAVFVSMGALITALSGMAMLIPGDHPDKELSWISARLSAITAWVTKYSRK